MKFLTKFITHIPLLLHLHRSAPERTLVHPMREWVTCLTVSVVVGITLFIFAGLDFYTQYTDYDMSEIPDVSVPKYREEDATSIIKYYEGRSSQFRDLRAQGSPVPIVIPTENGETNLQSESGARAVKLPPEVAETPVAQ